MFWTSAYGNSAQPHSATPADAVLPPVSFSLTAPPWATISTMPYMVLRPVPHAVSSIDRSRPSCSRGIQTSSPDDMTATDDLQPEDIEIRSAQPGDPFVQSRHGTISKSATFSRFSSTSTGENDFDLQRIHERCHPVASAAAPPCMLDFANAQANAQVPNAQVPVTL